LHSQNNDFEKSATQAKKQAFA